MYETMTYPMTNPLAPDTLTNLSDAFLFLSPHRSLRAEGCFQRFERPAEAARDPASGFQQELQALFASAREAGIKRPILVGALPFDTRKPSLLHVPQHWRWVDHATCLQQAQEWPVAALQSDAVQPLPDQAGFMQQVEQAVARIAEGELDKVVLSRLLDIHTPQPLNTTNLMARIISQNPQGYDFHLPLPDGSVLLGASPELLLRKDGALFYSQPLAGTSGRSAQAETDQQLGAALLDSGKNRHEHQLVIDAMRSVLQPRSLHLDVPEQPALISTPTLWHLATLIQGEVQHPADNALMLASLLHPTPALSGFPHPKARELISQLEPFDREEFGGIVGWCDDQGNGEWVVAIRCGKVQQNHLRLFAGAGIVHSSSPLAEWQETGIKFNTMLRAFGLEQEATE